jgi:U3 small nucleolar RNA-associated protein 7
MLHVCCVRLTFFFFFFFFFFFLFFFFFSPTFQVHQLLDKLPPETIALDQNFVGRVDGDRAALKAEQAALAQADAAARNADAPAAKEKNRARGRSKIGAKLKRKRKNVVDVERVALQERLHKEQAAKKAAKDAAKAERKKAKGKGGGAAGSSEPVDGAPAPPAAIARFFAK